jgi:hypothetical protein
MDFIHRPKSKISKIKKLKSRFGSWLCFRLQVNGGGEEKDTYSIHLRKEAEPASETT